MVVDNICIKKKGIIVGRKSPPCLYSIMVIHNKEVIIMKVFITDEELELFRKYDINNFQQLKEVLFHTGDERLAAIYTRSLTALIPD